MSMTTSRGLLGYCAIKLYDKVYSKFIVNASSIVQDRDFVENQDLKISGKVNHTINNRFFLSYVRCRFVMYF